MFSCVLFSAGAFASAAGAVFSGSSAFASSAGAVPSVSSAASAAGAVSSVSPAASAAGAVSSVSPAASAALLRLPGCFLSRSGLLRLPGCFLSRSGLLRLLRCFLGRNGLVRLLRRFRGGRGLPGKRGGANGLDRLDIVRHTVFVPILRRGLLLRRDGELAEIDVIGAGHDDSLSRGGEQRLDQGALVARFFEHPAVQLQRAQTIFLIHEGQQLAELGQKPLLVNR